MHVNIPVCLAVSCSLNLGENIRSAYYRLNKLPSLVIYTPRMIALWTLVEDSAPFIHRPQLYRIVSNFLRITPDTRFGNRGPLWLVRCL